MTLEQILIGAVVTLMPIVGYFLNKTITELKTTSDLAVATKAKLDVLENDHVNKHQSLSTDMQRLTKAIEDNTKEMKDFRNLVFEKLSNL